MFYYTAFIVAIISIVILLMGLLLDRRSRSSKAIAAYIICSICAVWLSWNSRTTSNLRLHEKMTKAESIIINDQTIDNNYATSETILFPRMADAPVYIQQYDILTDIPLIFLSGGEPIHAKLVTLREAGNYPEEGITEFHGRYYCIVSTKVLYRNAMFYLDKEYVRNLLSVYLQESIG